MSQSERIVEDRKGSCPTIESTNSNRKEIDRTRKILQRSLSLSLPVSPSLSTRLRSDQRENGRTDAKRNETTERIDGETEERKRRISSLFDCE